MHWPHGCGVLTRFADWHRGYPTDVERTPPWAAYLYGRDVATAVADSERRRISGVVLNMTTAASGLTSGSCTLLFERQCVVLVHGADMHNPVFIPYHDTTSLQVGGRGDVVTTSGGGWRGYGRGLEGMAMGMANAAIMNALTTQTRHRIETIVTFAWSGGTIALLDNHMLPQHWAALLAPVFRRIEEAHRARAQQASIGGAERTCPFCAEKIKAAALKCRYCGSNVEPTVH